MNKRIKELSLQAGEYTNSVYTPPERSKTPGKIWEDGHIDWHELYNEKFAELIVKECAVVARAHTLEKYHGLMSGYNGIVYVEEAIKQHFEVE